MSTTDTVERTDYHTGIDILLEEDPDDPWFGPGAGATTMMGGIIKAFAMDLKTRARFECATASATGAKSVRANFGSRGLPIGRYRVDIFGKPTGYEAKRLYSQVWDVEESAAPPEEDFT